MNTLDSTLFLLGGIILGMVAQQILSWLGRHKKKTAYTILRPIVLGYWVTLSLVIATIGGIQIMHGEILAGIGGMAFGLGLMLARIGQTFDQRWLANTGMVVLAAGPAAGGIGLLQAGDELGGLVALTLGLGILIGRVRGPAGGIGRMVVGAVLAGGGVMLTAGAIVPHPDRPDLAAAVIGMALFLMGLSGIVCGGVALVFAARLALREQRTTPA
jgi:hypothetical protein